MCFVDGGEADPDRQPRTELRVSTAIAVFVPRQTREPLDRLDALEESLCGDIGEVFAERIAGEVPVAE